MYWFWRGISVMIPLIIAWLIDPAGWGICGAKDNPILCFAIRIGVFLILFVFLSSFDKRKKK